MRAILSMFWVLALLGIPQTAGAQGCCHPMETQGIAYVSGGVGEDERGALMADAARYSLKLIFAEKTSGAFLADVHVSVSGGKGAKSIEAVSEGPWFFADLPPGTYKVSVAAGGQEMTRAIAIKQGAQSQAYFYWP